MVVPILAWMLVNLGISANYPPLLASVGAAKSSGGNWLSAWLGLLPPALFVVSSYWAAATFIWFLAIHAIELESSDHDLLSAIILWGTLLSPVAALILYFCGLSGIGLAVVVVLVPVIYDQLALGNLRKRKIHP